MKIKIIKCSSHSYWYKDQIGNEFEATQYNNNYIITDKNNVWIKGVDISDAEVLNISGTRSADND